MQPEVRVGTPNYSKKGFYFWCIYACVIYLHISCTAVRLPIILSPSIHNETRWIYTGGKGCTSGWFWDKIANPCLDHTMQLRLLLSECSTIPEPNKANQQKIFWTQKLDGRDKGSWAAFSLTFWFSANRVFVCFYGGAFHHVRSGRFGNLLLSRHKFSILSTICNN